MMFYSSTHRERIAQTFVVTAALVASALAILSASTSPQHGSATAAAQQKPAAGQKPGVDIMLTSKPTPPKTGENTFEVTVKEATGKPLTDAEVTALLYMGPLGAMPEMKHSITLKHQKDGRYIGTGQVMMAGKWDITVTVKRDGKEIGSKKFPVTAQ